jgi:uncharacterized coiled-coil DUF342 family protein
MDEVLEEEARRVEYDRLSRQHRELCDEIDALEAKRDEVVNRMLEIEYPWPPKTA